MKQPKPPKCLKFLRLNLAEALRSSGLTQAEVARRSDVTPTYLNQVLKGTNSSPGLAQLESICSVLGLSVSESLRDPNATIEIDPTHAAAVVNAHLQFLAKKHGYPWPPPIDFLAKILK